MTTSSNSPLKPEHVHGDQVKWITMEKLLKGMHLTCIDGRQEGCYFSGPGGEMGFFLALLGGAELLTGHQFSGEQTQNLLREYMDFRGSFYLHSDDHALAELAQALDLPASEKDDGGDSSAIIEIVSNPPPELRERLGQLLLQPGHVGCGHLANMLKQPDSYSIRQKLVEEAMTGFFQALWDNNPRAEFVVLQGKHREEAVLTIQGPPTLPGNAMVPAWCALADGPNLFVNHAAAQGYVLDQAVPFLIQRMAGMVSETPDAGKLKEEVAALAAKHLGATAQALASGLPFHLAKFEGVDIRLVE